MKKMTNSNPPVHVIGAGGTGSWLIPQLLKLAHPIILWDGDTYEERNLDRQLFSKKHIGMNKAEAMATMYGKGITPLSRWFYADADKAAEIEEGHYIFCCADNHRARREVLDLCDRVGCIGVVMGNGYTDSDAYIYFRDWMGSPSDPRIRYPDILDDNTGDPIAAAGGCTGDAQRETPQLVLANARSAADGLHLFWFYSRELEKMKNFKEDYLPVENRSNLFEKTTYTREDINKAHQCLTNN